MVDVPVGKGRQMHDGQASEVSKISQLQILRKKFLILKWTQVEPSHTVGWNNAPDSAMGHQ